MRRTAVLWLLFSFQLSALGQSFTRISGDIWGQLSLDNSPHLVVDNVPVPLAQTLTVEPGVHIYIMRKFPAISFWIFGKLVMVGTRDYPITIEGLDVPADNPISWGGIFYFDNDTLDHTPLEIAHVRIYNTSYALRYYYQHRNVVVHNSIFGRSWKSMLFIGQDTTYIYNNVFIDMEDGIVYSDAGSSDNYQIIENNIFLNLNRGLNFYDENYDYLIKYNDFYDVSDYVLQNDSSVEPDTTNILLFPELMCDWAELRSTSPLIDAGDPDWALDPDGTRADIGAKYYDHQPQPVNFTGALPDTIAKVGSEYNCCIYPSGYPPPQTILVEHPPNMAYYQETGELIFFPDLDAVGGHPVRLVTENLVEGTTYRDTLDFMLRVVENRAPQVLSSWPHCNQIPGSDTTYCLNSSPSDSIEVGLEVFEPDGDLLFWGWDFGISHGTSVASSWDTLRVVVTPRQIGDNYLTIWVTDAEDTTWNVWDFVVQGIDLTGEITLNELNPHDLYYIFGPSWVTENDTLTIPGGSRIFIGPETDDAELIVNGFLKVEGTEEDPVVFSFPQVPDQGGDVPENTMFWNWEGITFPPQSKGGSLYYARIENARRAVFARYIQGDLVLKNVVFNSDSIAVQSHYANLEITNCQFQRGYLYGVFAEGGQTTEIRNSGFANFFLPVYGYRTHLNVVNNTFFGIENYASGSLPWHQVTVLGGELTLQNNILANFREMALFVDELAVVQDISYNCFWADSVNAPRANRDLPNYEPLFADPRLEMGTYQYDEDYFSQFDFRLQTDSPCINRGSPFILDLDGTRSDIGMYGGPGAQGGNGPLDDPQQAVPADFVFTGVYPNPFNETARIDFSLPADALVNCWLYDLLGRRVRLLFSDRFTAGHHVLPLSGENLASGIYFVVLNSCGSQLSQKVLFLK